MPVQIIPTILTADFDEFEDELKKIEKFVPNTNLVFNSILTNTSLNLNVLDENELLQLYHFVGVFKDTDILFSGFSVDDWLHDIEGRLSQKQKVNKTNKLRVLKAQLDELLSSDKKRELQLAAIEASLLED